MEIKAKYVGNKINTHGQSAAAMKAESRMAAMKATNRIYYVAMKAEAHKFPK